MNKKILALILFVVVTLPSSVFAGELLLIKGKGVPVCEAHYKNLNKLKFFEEMVCDRDKYYSEQNSIARPKWKELDLRENKELVKKIKKIFYYGDQFEKMRMYDDKDEFESYLEELIRIGDRMFFTIVDTDNDGKKEKVILYKDGRCMDTHAYWRALLVLDEVNNEVDVKKTKPLLEQKIDPHGVIGTYQMYDVFFYKNQAYFDRWDTDDRTGTVYIDSKGKTKEVCSYNYKK